MKKLSTMMNNAKARLVAAREDSQGFTLLELVVAVGIILILSVAGLVAYSKITDNARHAAVEAAASDVFTAAYAYESDNDPATKAEQAATEYNDTAAKNNGGTAAIEVTVEGTKDSLVVTATNAEHSDIKATKAAKAAKA